MLYRQLDSKDSGFIYILNYIIMTVAQLVAGLILAFVFGSLTDSALWFLMILNQFVFMVMTFVYVKSKGINPIAITGYKHKLTNKQIIMLPIITVLLLISSAPIAMLFGMFTKAIGYNSQSSFPAIDTLGLFILAFVVMAILPPLGEEFLFRNAILRGLKNKGYLFAAVITSMMFSLMHGNVDQLVHQFFVGMVLAYVMQVTNTLWAPIIVHFSNNAIAIFLNLDFLNSLELLIVLLIFLILIIFGSVLVIMALKYFHTLEMEKRTGNHIIEANPDNFIVKYGKTAKAMLCFLFSHSRRKKYIESYNSTMKGLDYDAVVEEPSESKDAEFIKLLIRNNDNPTIVYVGMVGAAIMVMISFLLGYVNI